MKTTTDTGAGYRPGWQSALLLLFACWQVSGCSYMISSATGNLADGLTSGILNQNDPETVRQGAPAFLLMIDGLIVSNPKSERLLRTGSALYVSYATAFVDEPERARQMTDRAWEYAKRGLCIRRAATCKIDQLPYDEFVSILPDMTPRDVPALYAYGGAWAGWIESHPDDWTGIANIPKVEAIMQRVIELDEDYENGGAHLYLGVLSTLLPPSLGGKPEKALVHFNRLLELSNGRNLMAKVVIAERYARPLFKRKLHDKVLNEVLAGKPDYPGYTLMNMLAKERAKQLMDSANDYF